ncbi:Leucine-rich repeat-containing protein 47 [Pseudolycoriella hygida]|uniref:Leucine-rich repeat-containing protein 47 n=1 Tax=Pseudolycoriella hygida TaxID=35572 RepID=A0A9Q0S4P4_9DIPT|nr:Leucine-rich repeat-containing protein 47 [Pseudolycoriella hygida]
MEKRCNSSGIKVVYDDLTESVRPFILCCVVKKMSLQDNNKLRKFMRIQTKIHDSDIGGKRENSSIGTHDLSKIALGGFIRYTAKTPETLSFIPLGRHENITAFELITSLKAEAQTIRKQIRRKITSGIYKYLHLVENKQRLACLEDAFGNVICMPPLLNSELTKVSTETSDIFVEITSSSSMTDCYATMEEFLKQLLIAGFGEKPNLFDRFDHLTVEPVRIVDSYGQLKAIYPSTTEIYLDRYR